jgi:pimeloyl-ACP methyl ester carboxylesterase
MTSQFETSDGTLLNVDESGDGLPVVFLHGLCGDAGQTREAFPGEHGLRRVTIEARGHGKSQAGPLEKLSIATFASDVARYIESRMSAPVVVGGISMGAAISLRLAVTRPDLVRALIIARPAWMTASAPENMSPNAEVGRLLKQMPADQARTAFLEGQTGRFLAEDAADNLASLNGFFSRLPIEVTAALLEAIANDGPGVTEADVAALAMPCLVIGHAKDYVHPLPYARALAGLVPKARLVEITPKVDSRARYISDFHAAIISFTKDL